MVSATQVPAAAICATLKLLYFAMIESGEVLAAFLLCLARVSLAVDEFGHGLTRRHERRLLLPLKLSECGENYHNVIMS